MPGRRRSCLRADYALGGVNRVFSGKTGWLEASPQCGRLSVCGGRSIYRFDQRHVHKMLADEPHLQFVGTEHITDHKIVGAVIS